MSGKVKILLPKFQRVTAIGKEVKKWTDPNSIYFRLPEHYKRRHREFLNTMPKPVHYKASEKKWEVDHEHGVKKLIRDTPIVVLHPTQARLGIWGGEGIIPGYIRPFMTGFKRPQYLSTKLWRPKILKAIFYSEILNQHYALTCTRRTFDLIEEAKGFDFYILKTHEVDLCSDIGMQLKREMLIRLAKKDTELYPDDKEKAETIYNRYKEFVIPLEEAEWIGLKPWEAMTKQKKIEEEKLKESIRPLKEAFAFETLKQLTEGELNQEAVINETKKTLFKRMIEEIFSKNKPPP